MSARGMGAVYTHGHALTPLRRNAVCREDLMRRFYLPHHQALEAAVRAHLDRFGSALVVDCHSFPEVSQPYEMDQTRLRPEICIGTDPFHTPEIIAGALERIYRSAGYLVARNTPFAGSIVPASSYHRDPRVRSVMIELRRDIYMDEVTTQLFPTSASLPVPTRLPSRPSDTSAPALDRQEPIRVLNPGVQWGLRTIQIVTAHRIVLPPDGIMQCMRASISPIAIQIVDPQG